MAVRKLARIPLTEAVCGDPRQLADALNRQQTQVAQVVDKLATAANQPTQASAQGVPSGALLPFAGTKAPAGFLLCDGSAVSRTTYAALFAAIGTAYGAGDGGTTFNLPDMRSRLPVGAGQGAGLTNRALAATGGEEAHALSTAELAAHSHGVTDTGHTHFISRKQGGSGAGGDAMLIPGSPNGTAHDSVSESATTGVVVQSAGSGAAHNTMPPFLAVNWIVKT